MNLWNIIKNKVSYHAVYDESIIEAPRSKALESIKNLKQIFSSSA